MVLTASVEPLAPPPDRDPCGRACEWRVGRLDGFGSGSWAYARFGA
jgi:hypothetical protein